MTWKRRTYDDNRPHKPSTPAQDAARARSWRIFNLRSLAESGHCLSPARRRILRALIDDQLKALNANTTAQHYEKVMAEMDARHQEKK